MQFFYTTYNDFINYLNTLTTNQIALWALFVAALAAFVSALLWLAAIQSKREALMPIVVLFWRLKGPSRAQDELCIRNEGNGPALNVEIDSWNIFLRDIHKTLTLTATLPSPNILEKREERALIVKCFEDGQELNQSAPYLKGLYDPITSPFKATIMIWLQDILGRWYVMKISAGKGQLKIIAPPRRYGLIQRTRRCCHVIYNWFKLRVLKLYSKIRYRR